MTIKMAKRNCFLACRLAYIFSVIFNGIFIYSYFLGSSHRSFLRVSATPWRDNPRAEEEMAMCTTPRQNGDTGHCYITANADDIGLNNRKLKIWPAAIVSTPIT